MSKTGFNKIEGHFRRSWMEFPVGVRQIFLVLEASLRYPFRKNGLGLAFHSVVYYASLLFIFPLVEIIMLASHAARKIATLSRDKVNVRRNPNSESGIPHQLLSLLKWFFRGESRVMIEQAIGDLKKDAQAMRKEGRSKVLIFCAQSWGAICTLMPIMWDGIVRILKKVWPLGALAELWRRWL